MLFQRQRRPKDVLPKMEGLREDVKDVNFKDKDAKDKLDVFLMHQIGQQMRPDLGRSAFPLTRSMTAGNYVPQVANSSSSRNFKFEGSDPIYLDMANLSLNDSQTQIPTHLSPTSDRQVGLNPTDQMGSSAYPSTSDMRSPHYDTVQQGSHGLTLPTVDPNSDRTREDRSVHRTNIDSFNENNDTVRD